MSDILSAAEARLARVAVAALGADDGAPGRPAAWALAIGGHSRVAREAVAVRAEVGLARYGALLRRGWRWAPLGAWQEALDLVVYLAADEGATPRERALAAELVELLAARLLRVPLGQPLAPSELRAAA
jgi:hypothetical protein